MEGDDGRVDSFDDLFEPFELEEPPPPGAEPVRPEPEGYVACPSCGTRNPPQNRHCEACGARVAQGPLPVAPQPMLRTTPGARALGILTAVVLVVALLALLVNFFRSDPEPTDPTTAGGSDGTGATVTTLGTPQLPIEQLRPTEVRASSQLDAFPADHLIDGDPATSWNDASLQGVDAQLEFFFPQPVQISQIVVYNVTDPERFARNYRIRGLQIFLDDINQTIIREMPNNSDPFTIDVGSLETTVVTMQVTSTWPAESFNSQAPFEELALQEVEFFGKVVGS